MLLLLLSSLAPTYLQFNNSNNSFLTQRCEWGELVLARVIFESNNKMHGNFFVNGFSFCEFRFCEAFLSEQSSRVVPATAVSTDLARRDHSFF